MQPPIRAVIAAAAHAFVIRRKVAGLYDHHAARDLRVAAEARGRHLQGYDGERDARFGGTLPDLRDMGEDASIHMVIEGAEARGFDRGSSSHFTARVTDEQVQLYDHGENAWFAFDVRTA